MARTNRCLCGVRHGGKISGAQEASLDEEGLLLSIFQSLPKISVIPKPKKKPSESQRELLECSFPGPGPSSLTQDFWGSGDGCCYFRDHCLETTDGQPLPPLTKYLRTSSTAWTTAHSLDYFPLSQAPLTSFCPVFKSLALIQNCRMEMEGF